MPADIQLKTPDSQLTYQFVWADELSTDVQLLSVVHTVPPGISLEEQDTDTDAGTSIVRISGGTHGQLYVVRALAQTSDGEEIPSSFTLRVMALTAS